MYNRTQAQPPWDTPILCELMDLDFVLCQKLPRLSSDVCLAQFRWLWSQHFKYFRARIPRGNFLSHRMKINRQGSRDVTEGWGWRVRRSPCLLWVKTAEQNSWGKQVHKQARRSQGRSSAQGRGLSQHRKPNQHKLYILCMRKRRKNTYHIKHSDFLPLSLSRCTLVCLERVFSNRPAQAPCAGCPRCLL